MENETTELIDQYLLDQLDAPARQLVENRIQTDPQFAEEVTVQRAIVRQARRLGREGLRQQLRTIAAANAQTPDAAPNLPAVAPIIPLRSGRSLWPYLAVAASLLLIMGIWFWNTQSTNSDTTIAESAVAVTVPLVQAGSAPAMGFASRNDTTDITVLVYPGTAPGQYRFDDTLRLYGTFNPAQLTVTYLPDSSVYRLKIGAVVYPLERFKPRQPLVR